MEVAPRPNSVSAIVPESAINNNHANESYFEQSTDNEDVMDGNPMTMQQQERLRRLAFYQGKISRYEQFHISLCTLVISLVLPAIIIAISSNSVSDNTDLYLNEHK